MLELAKKLDMTATTNVLLTSLVLVVQPARLVGMVLTGMEDGEAIVDVCKVGLKGGLTKVACTVSTKGMGGPWCKPLLEKGIGNDSIMARYGSPYYLLTLARSNGKNHSICLLRLVATLVFGFVDLHPQHPEVCRTLSPTNSPPPHPPAHTNHNYHPHSRFRVASATLATRRRAWTGPGASGFGSRK